MFTCKHFYDEAADTPDVSFARVASLFDDFRRHPEHGALQRWPIDAVAR
jgi:hypothetical protein